MLLGDFNDSEVTSLPITLSGTIPTSGSLTYENNVLKSGTLIIGDYTATYSDGSFTAAKTSSISNEQSSGSGNPTPSNPYLTTFDGNYTYYVSQNDNLTEISGSNINNFRAYLRTDGTTPEVCGVFSDGIACMTGQAYGSYWNENYNYHNDFADCGSGGPTGDYDGTGEICIKGYAKAKADEMISKGASCLVDGEGYLYCSDENVGVSCNFSPTGSAWCQQDDGDYIYDDGLDNY